jgi:uncharacterized protein with PIN domain
MLVVTLRFYGPLNDFLASRSDPQICVELREPAAVKDVIEARGVPHPEVALILVDGASVSFEHRIRGGERIAVFPECDLLPVDQISRVLPPVLGERRFVLDGHLGRLAAYLRALGYDTRYDNSATDSSLAECSLHERRILLTRDVGLLKRSIVDYGYWVRNTDPEAQLFEVAARHALSNGAAPFSRCVTCNGLLRDVDKASIEHLLLPRTRAHQHEFRQCIECDQIFWPGSHYDRMKRLIEAVMATRKS